MYSGISKEIACEIEIELIKKYKSANRKYGYNISLGGDHQIVSEETRKKISEANRRRVYSKGRIISEEWRRKLIASHAKNPVICIETNIVYESVHEAQRQTGINSSNISAVCHGRLKTAGKLHWKFIMENDLR